jgi:DeoR family transcriptional regulator of aga operon/DeoR family fructose operon transcriptional repressor
VSKQLIPAQRREQIQQYLDQHKVVSSSDLSALLNVSEATVRRDLEYMEQAGILSRTHGGAVLSQQLQIEPEYAKRTKRLMGEKKLIGKLAASLIQDGDIVFVNSGTTTTQLIHQLHPDIDASLITNNLAAVLEIGEFGYEMIVLGGNFQPKSRSAAGRFAIENLSQIYADQSFIGVDGINPEQGCTVPSSSEAEVIKLMVERTKGPVSILADHSKWGLVSNFEVAKFGQFERFISDPGLTKEALNTLSQYPIEVLIGA